MISKQLERYRRMRNIPLDLPVGLARGKKGVKLTWGDNTMTAYEWSESLDVCWPAFSRRMRVYGTEDPRTFMTKKELMIWQMKNFAWPARDASNKNSSGRGNEEWRALAR